MIVPTCSLFFSHFRLHMVANLVPVLGRSDASPTARVVFAGSEPPQKSACRLSDDGSCEIELEALLDDPSAFPGDGRLEVSQDGRTWRVTVVELLQRAAEGLAYPLFDPFRQAIAARAAEVAPRRPKLLDIGGRARSGVQRSEAFPDCEVTTFDIIPQEGVDVVGDAHELSRHFERSSFDFAISFAVYEHLAMPWKAAVETARVLKAGGHALVYSHQTVGMHDMPWDFFRFSDASWSAIFNRFTGFELVETKMTCYQHIIPRAWGERYRGGEAAGGFEFSAALVRKTGEPTVDWPVRTGDILTTMYPGGHDPTSRSAVRG